MKRVLIILSLITLAFALGADAQKKNENRCANANSLTEAEIDAVLKAHNQIRAGVGLPKLAWSCKMADLAQEWAGNGKFEHRADFAFGENLFVSSNAAVAPVSGVEKWFGEKANWDGSTGTCQTGKICTHYTQLIAKETTEVGCGINRNAAGRWKVLMVCNYNPAGNVIGKLF